MNSLNDLYIFNWIEYALYTWLPYLIQVINCLAMATPVLYHCPLAFSINSRLPVSKAIWYSGQECGLWRHTPWVWILAQPCISCLPSMKNHWHKRWANEFQSTTARIEVFVFFVLFFGMSALSTSAYENELVYCCNKETNLTAWPGRVMYDHIWGRKPQHSGMSFTNRTLPKCMTQYLRNSHSVVEFCYNQFIHVWGQSVH